MFFINTQAQNMQITGNVAETSGESLFGVSVVVQVTTQGTTTDFDGNYSINANTGDVLVFSYVGYESRSVTVGQNNSINVTLNTGVELDSIVLIGSRNPARTAVNSAVAVDVFNMKELQIASPQVNLNQILNMVAPSFNSNTQTISDGTDHVDPAALRGLGPDQFLVLINGKRRHTSSLVNVNGTFGRGNVGTDLNAIPAAAIERIEVLRDGAAAQYGSDAIAGVINIVLKKSTDELTVSVTAGAHFSENSNFQTGGVDGETTNISASYGVKLNDRGGYVNFSGDFDVREDYSRMKEWEGNVFNRYNTVERLANNAGFDLNALPNDLDAVINFANQAGFDIPLGTSLADVRSNLETDNTDAELAARGLNKTDFNMRVDQSALRGGRFFANFSLPLDDNGTELYSFAGISSRTGNSAGFYRMPNEARAYTPIYINGFLPEINSTINDKSLAAGIKGKIGEFNVDFSNTFGRNQFLFTIGNTSNASLQQASPTTFDAGGYAFTQNTTNLDLNRFYDDIFSGLNVAFGAEHRFERYEIFAGQLESYAQYTANGEVISLPSQAPDVARDFFGRARPGGSQVFPGFGPANEVNRTRSSVAAYVDFEADLSDKFLLSLASRYENYPDFGSTINFKLASLYRATETLNLRASFNTGFRAPSLHQLYFNSTSTIFTGNTPTEVGTFANDSRAAKLLGIPELKQETSKSVSLGFTKRIPDANQTITADAYWVGIDDRVVYTGRFRGNNDSPGGIELSNILAQANAGAAAFFANAIDTESKGLDVVIAHTARLGQSMVLKTDLSATLSQTRRVGDIKASELLTSAGLVGTYFSPESAIFLEQSVPRTKAILSNALQVKKFNIFLRNAYFGEVTEATNNLDNQQVFSSKVVTDLSVGYKLSNVSTVTIGANNLLDKYPDRAYTELGNRSLGRFDWSRRAPQIGIGGRFLFARFTYNLK